MALSASIAGSAVYIGVGPGSTSVIFGVSMVTSVSQPLWFSVQAYKMNSITTFVAFFAEGWATIFYMDISTFAAPVLSVKDNLMYA